MRLLLIRHGQTPANVLGRLDTAHPGPGLTALGAEQASRSGCAGCEPIDALFASTLVRTQLTAAPLAQVRGLPVEVLAGLHEVEAGDLESRSDQDAVRTYLETVFAWGPGDLDVGDARQPERPRLLRPLQRGSRQAIAGSGAGVAAVVSHGAAIRVWVAAHAGNVPPLFAADNPLDNTGIVVVDGSFEDGWTLTRWAEQPVGGRGPGGCDGRGPDGRGPDPARKMRLVASAGAAD